jgi:hypothetical protein
MKELTAALTLGLCSFAAPAGEDVFRSAVRGRASLRDPVWEDLKAHLRTLCEEHLTPGAFEYIDADDRRSEWWGTFQEQRRLPRALEHLAFGGILLDPKYGDAARKILTGLAGEWKRRQGAPLAPGEHANRWLNDALNAVHLNGGTAVLSLGLAYDLVRPGMSPAEDSQVGAYLATFVDYFLEHPLDPELKKPEWNIAAHGMAGLGVLARVLRSAGVLDEARTRASIRKAKDRSRRVLDLHRQADGAFLEGPGYGTSTFHSISQLAWALAREGDRELWEHPAWEKAVEGLLYEMIPGSRQINPLNDTAVIDIATIDWLAMVAADRKNGVAQWLWQTLKTRGGKIVPEGPRRVPRKSVLAGYLLAYDPTVRPVSPREAGLPPSKYFEKRGLVDFRTGWEEDDAFVSFLCDVSPKGGHRQADRNHFAFFALGELFAIDSGKAAEPAEKGPGPPLLWGAQGIAHSLPLFHGEMQRWVSATNDGVRKAVPDGPLPVAEAEAGDGYALAQRFTRRVVFLPPTKDHPAALVVADVGDLTPEGALLLSWLLHTDPKNAAEIDGTRLTLVGGRKGNRCQVEMATPARPGRWRRDTFQDHPLLRYDWTAGALRCVVALTPYRANASPPPVRAASTKRGCAVSVARGGRVDTVLSAGGAAIAHDGIETDAEFAAVARENGAVVAYHVASATFLRVDGRALELPR